jgi:hypothetical protein
MNYHQQLRDPRWEKLRLEVLQRDDWRCQEPACAHRHNARVMLVVHHKQCLPGRDPWDYPAENLITLCEKCHDRIHQREQPNTKPVFSEGTFYAWHEIRQLVRHEPYGYLTQVKDRIVCGCFRLDLNPGAPGIVYPGAKNPQWIAKARLFHRQATAIPIFIKGEGLPWEFVGNYRVESTSQAPEEIQEHKARSGVPDIGLIMLLSKA